MEGEQQALCRELEMVDADLGFLFLIILAVLLSYRATVRQRDALCLTIRGDTETAARVGNVERMRLASSALGVGSLGFFFMQTLESCQGADPADATACRSARLDLIAGFLALLAALIRLLNFNMVRYAQPALDNTLPPV